jgi:glucan phosphoethanolaminetransferase (alkaline phosphatase superfamily)
MVQEKFCEGCDQSNKCQEIYRKLGSVKGPSVALKVIVAFLLPLVVFTVSLAVFERVFARSIATEGLRTAISLLAAFVVTFIFMLIVKVIGRRMSC